MSLHNNMYSCLSSIQHYLKIDMPVLFSVISGIKVALNILYTTVFLGPITALEP